jgi:hypothetical protein
LHGSVSTRVHNAAAWLQERSTILAGAADVAEHFVCPRDAVGRALHFRIGRIGLAPSAVRRETIQGHRRCDLVRVLCCVFIDNSTASRVDQIRPASSRRARVGHEAGVFSERAVDREVAEVHQLIKFYQRTPKLSPRVIERVERQVGSFPSSRAVRSLRAIPPRPTTPAAVAQLVPKPLRSSHFLAHEEIFTFM